MKTVLLIENSSCVDDGETESIVLGTFDEPNADAVRQLLNVGRNAESHREMKISFEQWTDDQIRKSELAGSILAGEELTPEERAEWLRLGGDPAFINDED